MIHLPDSRNAWGSTRFEAVLKRELASHAADLPLQAALSFGSAVHDAPIEAMLLGATEDADRIEAQVGVFFAGIVAGCNCADDPTPVEPQHEYCELLLIIDKATAATVVLVQ
jgi:hypothetical protein